jgi:hypothetical protein
MKKWSVILSPKATIQIREAALYYNSKSKGLGKRFHGEINICLKQLVVNPYFLPTESLPQDSVVLYAYFH